MIGPLPRLRPRQPKLGEFTDADIPVPAVQTTPIQQPSSAKLEGNHLRDWRLPTCMGSASTPEAILAGANAAVGTQDLRRAGAATQLGDKAVALGIRTMP